MLTKYTREAFKSLDLLEDADFDLSSKEGFAELGDFLDDDIPVETEVIDLEAESEEEVKDSYVGEIILSCPICHTNLFKPLDDLTLDEETDRCNVGEPCPVCGDEDGFTILGKVAPFNEEPEEEEVEVEVDSDGEVEVEVDEKEEIKEAIRKRLDKKLQEAKRSRKTSKRKLNEAVDVFGKPVSREELSAMIFNFLNEDVYSGYGWITVDYLVDVLDLQYNIQADFNEVMSILTTDLGYIIDVIDGIEVVNVAGVDIEEIKRELNENLNKNLNEAIPKDLKAAYSNSSNYEIKQILKYSDLQNADYKELTKDEAKELVKTDPSKLRLLIPDRNDNLRVVEIRSDKPFGTIESNMWLKEPITKRSGAIENETKKIGAKYLIDVAQKIYSTNDKEVSRDQELTARRSENPESPNYRGERSQDYSSRHSNYNSKEIDRLYQVGEPVENLYIVNYYNNAQEAYNQFLEYFKSWGLKDIDTKHTWWAFLRLSGEQVSRSPLSDPKIKNVISKQRAANRYTDAELALRAPIDQAMKNVRDIKNLEYSLENRKNRLSDFTSPEGRQQRESSLQSNINYYKERLTSILRELELAEQSLEDLDDSDMKRIQELNTEIQDITDKISDLKNENVFKTDNFYSKRVPESLEESLKENKENWNDDESLTEAKKTLDDLYEDPELEEIWNSKFNELVPKTGKAQTTIGEIMRCFSRISHAFLQNGDMLTKGWANRSTYDAADDLYDALGELGDKELYDLFDKKIYNTRSESAYDHYLAQFYETFIDKYLKQEDESLTEDIEKATIETEDQVIEVKSEPKEDTVDEVFEDTDEEMVAPLSDEEIEQISTQVEEEPTEETETEDTEFTEEEPLPEDEEADFDFEEVQEESLNRLANGYLKKVYSNVESFSLTEAVKDNNKLTLNGNIIFKSGKEKPTSFVFEKVNDNSKGSIAKSKVRLVGLNETFTNKNNAYVLRAKIRGNQFIAESLRYDYPAKTSKLNESVKIIKGFVK